MGRPRSVIAQGSTPAPIDHVVNDDETERLGSRRSLRLLSRITRGDGIAKCMKQNTQIKKNIKNAILLESNPLRPRTVIAQGSTPAPIDHVVNDDETERLGSRRSLRLLSRTTHRDGIAKCMKQNTQIKKNIKNAILLESSPLRPRTVIAQGSTPAPIDHVVNDDETERSRSRKSLGLSSIPRRDGIAKCMKQNTQIKKNIKNAILLESSPLRPRSVIAQGSTPASIDHVVNDAETECSRSRKSLGLSSIPRRDGIAKCMKQNTQIKKNIKNAILSKSSQLRSRLVTAQGSTPASIDHIKYKQLKLHIQNDINMDNDRKKRYLNMIKKHESRMKTLNDNSDKINHQHIKYEQLKLDIQNDINMDNDRKKRYLNMIKKHESRMKTLNDNSDKINHQHNDHYNAKNMMIDYVNDDCLAEIFMYLPAWERPKIALVCKKWKRALEYSWFNVKKFELTYWEYHDFVQWLEKYSLIEEKLNFLKSLFDKCGRYLTTLDFTAYGYTDIVPIVNDYCPNLVKLRLRFDEVNNTDDIMFSNAFTRLSKLKSLTIILRSMRNKIIPVTLINSLRNVASTLTELNLLNFVRHLGKSCDYPKEFYCVIRELKALKSFEVVGVRDSKNLVEYFNNNEMSFYFNHNEYLKKPPYLGHRLINIRILDLTSYFIKDDTLYTIANTIGKLKMLTINCAQITDDGVVALSKMNNLQILYLNGHNNVIDSSIKLLKNKVKLSLPRSNKITDVSVTKLVENSPKIEKLLLHYTTSLTANFVKKAAEISSQRKQLLKISIHSLIPDVKRYESPYFKIYIIKNKEK